MPLLQNLRQRNGIFIFRRKVPRLLQPLIKRKEIVRSLGRCAPREARLEAKRLWIRSEWVFKMLVKFKRHEGEESNLIGPDQLKLFVDAALDLYHYNDQYVACADADADAKKLTSSESILVQLECWAKQARTDRAKHDISDVVDEIQELAEQLDIQIRRGSMSEKLIAHELLQAQARYYEEQADQLRTERGLPANPELRNLPLEALKDRLNDAWQQVLGAQSSNSPTQLQNTGAETHTPMTTWSLDANAPASVAWKEFIRNLQTAGIREKPRKVRSSLNLWTSEYGDLPLKQWSRLMADNLRNHFVRLPNNYAQNKKKWGKYGKPSKIAEAFQQMIQQAGSEPERIALREAGTRLATWNRHCSYLSKFWQWGNDNGLTYSPKNPFDGLALIVDEDDSVADGGSEQRKTWEYPEIEALFASPLFTGCRSPHRRHLPGEIVIRDALYWVVLIVAYTGMRREEICQLRVQHLRREQVDGQDIWYFDLKAAGLILKKTKRRKKKKKPVSGSKRWVTVPDALIQLGMIEALHNGRDPNEQLFPELYRSAANDTFGDKLGKNFGTYRKNYDKTQRKEAGDGSFLPLYARLRDLHSFRHSFCTELIRAGVPKEHAEELSGHGSRERESTFENYNHGATLRILKAASDKRVLPIDISRLVAAAERSPKVEVQAPRKRRPAPKQPDDRRK